MRFLLALRFLTIIRLPGSPKDIDPVELGRSTAYFPVVGLVVGLMLGAMAWLGPLVLPGALVNALIVVALVIISGGLHIDGFIDTCDGIGGQKTKEERWRIMHEGTIGAFGAAGAALLVLVKFVAISTIPPPLLLATVVVAPVISRWAMVYALFAYNYARPSGMGKVFQEETKAVSFVTATIIALAVSLLVFLASGVSPALFVAAGLMFLSFLTVVLLANYLKGKFGGLTGDCYGAVNEVTEAFVLIAVAMAAYRGWV